MKESTNVNILISGMIVTLLSYIFYKFYTFDPIDCGVIIHEQALGLTSRDSMQEILTVEDYIIQKIKSENNEESNIEIDEDQIEYMLKRWKTPSFIKLISQQGVIDMTICSCLIFFKFRIVNKAIITENYNQFFQGIIVNTLITIFFSLGLFLDILRVPINFTRLFDIKIS